jgi:Na+-transporting methylmalonyl-CoA/oxaloacetate decarboxylase gamma subunit
MVFNTLLLITFIWCVGRVISLYFEGRAYRQAEAERQWYETQRAAIRARFKDIVA